jgi:DNA packaging protein, QLRG family|nr:MAG TPA: tail connector protein [Caudoviricetes sp.]
MLNELKRYLNIENNEKDFLLENWILEAKEFIKSII